MVFQGYRLVSWSGAMVVVASVGEVGVGEAFGVDGGALPILLDAVRVVLVSCGGRKRA